jgi:hypothetical protein
MTLKEILQFRGELDRGPYVVSGLVLFGIKYFLDRAISLFLFDRSWFITDYFIRARQFDIRALSNQDFAFYATMITVSLPFIYIGTLLCIKRLRHAGMSPWLTILFFVPVLNFFLFLILGIVPARATSSQGDGGSLLANLIPKSRIGNIATAIGITVFISLLTTVISANYLQQYGWGLFVGTPFFIAFASAVLNGYHQPRTYGECLSVAFLSTVIFALFLLGLAFEGVLCIAMAMPLAFALAWIGGTIGYHVQKRNIRPTLTLLSVAIIIPFSSYYESSSPTTPRVLQVRTVVEINAKPDSVWDKLINFTEIDTPNEFLFRAGISYPVRAEIFGVGDTAVRHCVFNTGVFVEPIDIWDAPNLLRFSVQSEPDPLTELSPYNHISAPHLKGYFVSTKGEFSLHRTEHNTTVLAGSTWYRINLWPNIYWSKWTEFIIHQIHLRVLQHIKKEAERV